MTDLEETSAKIGLLGLFSEFLVIADLPYCLQAKKPAFYDCQIEVAPGPPLEYLGRPFRGRLAQGKLTGVTLLKVAS